MGRVDGGAGRSDANANGFVGRCGAGNGYEERCERHRGHQHAHEHTACGGNGFQGGTYAYGDVCTAVGDARTAIGDAHCHFYLGAYTYANISTLPVVRRVEQ
jgi:hypothetical protein